VKNNNNMGMRRLSPDEADHALRAVGENNPQIVVVNADICVTSCSKEFVKRFPERSFEVGIAEQNLVSFAAGLAHEGFVPYAFTRTVFMSMRACEQVRTDVCYGKVPVRLVAQGAGYSSGTSGATHCSLEDVAIMTSIGGLTVLEPSDVHMLALMLSTTADHPGPVYIRYGGMTSKESFRDEDFRLGKALIRREGDDGAFIVSGNTVGFAMEAAQQLKQDLGANVRVVDIHTLKPIDVDAVLGAGKTGCVVAAQDHNKTGGLGSLCASVILEAGMSCKFTVRGCPDRFVPLATPAFLYKENGYDAHGLYEAMKALL